MQPVLDADFSDVDCKAVSFRDGHRRPVGTREDHAGEMGPELLAARSTGRGEGLLSLRPSLLRVPVLLCPG